MVTCLQMDRDWIILLFMDGIFLEMVHNQEEIKAKSV